MTAETELRELPEKPAINTNVRLFDLVRFMRSELHQADLITDEEYAWLSGCAKMANDPKGGSPSPRRLEDYDSIRQHHAALQAREQKLVEALTQISRQAPTSIVDAVAWYHGSKYIADTALSPQPTHEGTKT